MSDVIARSVLEVGGDASGFEAAMARAEAAAKRGEAALVQSASKGSAAWAGVGQAATPGLAQLEGANKRAAESMLITAARMQGSAGAAALYKAQLKGLNTEALEPYAAVLNKAALSQTAVSKSADDFAKRLGLVNISAGQATAAMRQLPSQMTDVFVSLASGQPALTVLLQQGGQIKDTFGGFGNAFKALASVLTPARVVFGGVAAAVTALGFAYKAGAEETDDYRKAIVLTGNAAGVTIGQLQRMAMAVAASTGATQGKAAEVLTQLAGSAQVAGGQLKFLTEAAIRLERAGGPAALETAKAFAALADAPTEAAIKLSKSTGFLTAAVYEQARALELQGKKSEAAAVVQRAAAEDAERQARQLESGLGSLEKAWQKVWDTAKGAVDAMKDLGRGTSPEAAAEAIRNRLANTGPSGPNAESRAALQSRLNSYEKDARTAELLADLQRVGRAGNAARIEFDKIAESVRTSDLVLKSQVDSIRTFAAKAAEAGVDIGNVEDVIKRVQSLSAFNAQSIAIQQAKLQASATIAAANAAAQLADLQHQREQGVLTELGLLQRVGDLQAKLAEDEARRAKQAVSIAAQLPQEQRQAAVAKARAEADAADIRAKAARKKSTDDLADAVTRLERAERAEVLAYRDEADQAIYDLNARRGDVLGQLAEKHYEIRKALEDTAYAQAVESSAAQKNDLQRAITLRQLEGELELRREIRRIQLDAKNGVITAAAATDEIAKTRDEIASATRLAIDKIVQDFETNGARQISDSLLSALEDGFDNAWDYLKKLAKREVIRVTFQPVTNAIGQIISGALTQMQGGTPTGANYLQAASTLSSVYGAAQRGYGAVSGWFGGSSAGSSTALTGWDAAMVDAGAGATTTGASAGAAGAASSSFMTPAFWAAIIAMGYQQASRDYAEGFRSAQTRDAIDRYGPWISPMAGGETYLASLSRRLGMSDRMAEMLTGSTMVARVFGRAAPRVEAAGISGSITGGDFTGSQFADIVEKGGWLRSDRRYTNLTAATDDLNRFMDQGARDILQNVTRFGEALGLPAQQIATVTTDLRVVLTDDVEANKTALAQAFNQYGDDLVRAWADAVRPLAQYSETTAQTIQRVGAAITDVNQVLQSLGMSALQASVDGGRAAVALEGLFGGIDGLRQSASSYLANFYSTSEQQDLTRSAIGRALSSAGITSVPTSREQFRALVNAQDPMTEQGQRAIAALLGVADAFASVTEAARSADDILSERAQLERQILEAQGNTSAIRDLERNALDESNRALYDRLNAIKDEQAAAQAAQRAQEEAAAAAESAARAAQQAFDNLQAAIDQTIGRFQSPRERIDYGVAGVRADLAAAGVTASTSQLMGATRQQIADFAVAFVRLSNVSDEAKRAVVEAAGALFDLGQSAIELASGTIQGRLDEILGTYGDVESALAAPVETLADAFRRTRQEADSLQESLDRMLGRATQTVQEALADMLRRQSALGDFRGALADQIGNARLSLLSPTARVAAMRANEAVLTAQLGSASDPVAVAQRLQSSILERIRLESQLSTQVYADQIDALKRLRDLSADIAQFTAEMRIGDLSPLSPRGQLDAARALFDRTLSSAQTGDANATGNLLNNSRTFLDEARSYFASSAEYDSIFNSVTTALDSLGVSGAAADPQIQALEALRESTSTGSAATVEALTQLDSALASRASSDQARIDRQIDLAQQQITDIRTTNDLLRAQLQQRVDEVRELRERLDAIAANTGSISTTLDRELVTGPRP